MSAVGPKACFSIKIDKVLLLTSQLVRFYSHTICPVKLLWFFLSFECIS
jgi:hypothetical protein